MQICYFVQCGALSLLGVQRRSWLGIAIAVIDEAHALSLSMTGVHLALRGVPKVLLTADPGLKDLAKSLGAPMKGDVDSRPPLLRLHAVAAPSRRAEKQGDCHTQPMVTAARHEVGSCCSLLP